VKDVFAKKFLVLGRNSAVGASGSTYGSVAIGGLTISGDVLSIADEVIE
jgi:hypothetical protein